MFICERRSKNGDSYRARCGLLFLGLAVTIPVGTPDTPGPGLIPITYGVILFALTVVYLLRSNPPGAAGGLPCRQPGQPTANGYKNTGPCCCWSAAFSSSACSLTISALSPPLTIMMLHSACG